MIKVLPSLEDGRAFICVRNEFEHASTVVQILRGPGASSPLLDKEIQLSPRFNSDSEILLDVTDALLRGLPDDYDGTFQLVVTCEPEDQPVAPADYRLRVEQNIITVFESA